MTFVHSGKARLGSHVVGGLTTRRVRVNSWMPTRRLGVHFHAPKSFLKEQNPISTSLMYGLDCTLQRLRFACGTVTTGNILRCRFSVLG